MEHTDLCIGDVRQEVSPINPIELVQIYEAHDITVRCSVRDASDPFGLVVRRFVVQPKLM